MKTNISVITVADGYIVNYLDYWNPLVLAEALGQKVPVLNAQGVQS
ncbi:MAG: hypothetical protein WBA73_09410 [Devosia sp.]